MYIVYSSRAASRTPRANRDCRAINSMNNIFINFATRFEYDAREREAHRRYLLWRYYFRSFDHQNKRDIRSTIGAIGKPHNCRFGMREVIKKYVRVVESSVRV